MSKIKRALSLVMSVLLVLTPMVFMPSCTVRTGQDTGLNSLEELEQHNDVLHFQEYKVDHERLQGMERTTIALRADFHEYVEYTNARSYPSIPADEVLWYHIRYESGEEEVGGYICAPKDYLNKNYPVLIYNPGGGGLKAGDVQYTARFGFIVLASAYRGGGLGSTGKDGYSGEDVNDVIKLIDLAEEFTFTNGKLYMFGWSRGGMETYIVLSRDDRIDAAVAGAGPTDLIDFYDEYDVKRFKTSFYRYLGEILETHPEQYEARSAVCWPEKIDTPLWIAHGTADDTVLVHHSEDLYNAMNALGKDVKLTLYANMDHGDPYWAFLPDFFYWLKQH